MPFGGCLKEPLYLEAQRGFSKWIICRVISTLNKITLIITLRIIHLLSPLK